MIKKLCRCLCIVIALTLTCINTCFEKTEAILASGVIRLHVIANSDSPEDQNLKLAVRDRVLSESGNMFSEDCSIASARKEFTQSLEKIKCIAEEVIKENGADFNVRVSLGKSSFPTKKYGSLILPAGNYEALKIEIGEAAGRNWWCVLFPPLCFVDESCVDANTEAVHSIRENIGDEIAPLTYPAESTKLRFKTYEIWQKNREKLTTLITRTANNLLHY